MSDPFGYDGGAGTDEMWEQIRLKEQVHQEAVPYREAALIKAQLAYDTFKNELKRINDEYEKSVHYVAFKRIRESDLK